MKDWRNCDLCEVGGTILILCWMGKKKIKYVIVNRLKMKFKLFKKNEDIMNYFRTQTTH